MVSNSRCEGCGLLLEHCFCHDIPILNAELKLTLLTHPREFDRPSNTGKFVTAALSHARAELWQRGQSVNDLKLEGAPVLLFPPLLAAEYLQRQGEVSASILPPAQEFHYLLLDGTWQEAQKMFRQSSELQQLPLIELPPANSQFELRRNQQQGNLSTLEVVALLLQCLGENEQVDPLLQCLQRFNRQYHGV